MDAHSRHRGLSGRPPHDRATLPAGDGSAIRFRLRAAIPAVAMSVLGACGMPNHYLVHPRQAPEEVVTSSHDVFVGELLIHLEIARPPGQGPFPTVIVHPEGGKTAGDMQGILWDFAGRGYLAIAADYRRRIDGTYQPNLFAWRSEADVTAIVDVASAQLDVDAACIAVIGFSQGGVYSLLIAAHAPDRIRAVVSYYPVTDFPHWFAQERPNPFRRWAYSIVEWFFRRQSGARSAAEFQDMLRQASPYYLADAIHAPVMLVHGDADTTAPVEESQRMAERLAAAGNDVTLLVVPGGVHIFNFRQPAKAASAWSATLAFLDRHLQPCLDRDRKMVVRDSPAEGRSVREEAPRRPSASRGAADAL